MSFIYSFLDGHFGCFHYFPVTNKNATAILIHVSMCRGELFWGTCPEVKLMGNAPLRWPLYMYCVPGFEGAVFTSLYLHCSPMFISLDTVSPYFSFANLKSKKESPLLISIFISLKASNVKHPYVHGSLMCFLKNILVDVICPFASYRLCIFYQSVGKIICIPSCFMHC